MSIRRLVLLVVVVSCLGGAAHAAYLFDWTIGDPHVVFVPDANDQAIAAADILSGIWWGMDEDYMYFRMDLEAAPSGGSGGDIYGIYVDRRALGAYGSTHTFIPTELDTGIIDYFLVANWDQDTDFDPVRKRVWDGSSWAVTNIAADFQHTENGGTTLEWRVARTDLDAYTHPNPMFWGAILDVAEGKTTLDMTGAGVTPEPTTMALLGLGLGGLYLKRRRSKS